MNLVIHAKASSDSHSFNSNRVKYPLVAWNPSTALRGSAIGPVQVFLSTPPPRYSSITNSIFVSPRYELPFLLHWRFLR
jgi:hypothetical protein